MRTIITITVNRTKVPYEYYISAKGGGARPGRTDAATKVEAAAKAIELAIRHGGGGYHIFGPDDVINTIPTDMRNR